MALSDEDLNEAIQAAVEAHAACPNSRRVIGGFDVDKVAEMARELLAIRERAGQRLRLGAVAAGDRWDKISDWAENRFCEDAARVAVFVAYGDGVQAPTPAQGVDPEEHRRLGEHLAERGLIDPSLAPPRLYSEAEVRKAVQDECAEQHRMLLIGRYLEGLPEAVLRRLRGDGEATWREKRASQNANRDAAGDIVGDEP